MEVRDALEDDAPRLAALTGVPESVACELVHDRTTRVATSGADSRSEDPENDGGEPVGVVSFDARRDSVHLTQLAGTERALARLLREPIRFARREGMAVEVLIEEGRGDLREVVSEAGFERAGSGPAFDGRETIAFRLDP